MLLFFISIDTSETKLKKSIKEMGVTNNIRKDFITNYSNLHDSI